MSQGARCESAAERATWTCSQLHRVHLPELSALRLQLRLVLRRVERVATVAVAVLLVLAVLLPPNHLLHVLLHGCSA